MLRAVVHLEGNLRERDTLGRVEHAQQEARLEEAGDALVQVSFAEQPLFERRRNMFVAAAAIQVTARLHSESCGLLEGLR